MKKLNRLIKNVNSLGIPSDDGTIGNMNTLKIMRMGLAMACLAAEEHPTTTLKKALHNVELLENLASNDITPEEYAVMLSGRTNIPDVDEEDPELPYAYTVPLSVPFCLAHDENISFENAVEMLDENDTWRYFAVAGRELGTQNPKWISDEIRGIYQP